MAIHLANGSRKFDDEIGAKRTNSDYAELRLGIDLGYAKSISICGLGMLVDSVLLQVESRLNVSINKTFKH